jgi:hypothetical protein
VLTRTHNDPTGILAENGILSIGRLGRLGRILSIGRLGRIAETYTGIGLRLTFTLTNCYLVPTLLLVQLRLQDQCSLQGTQSGPK